MTGMSLRKTRIVLFLFAMLLAVQACAGTAFAADAELLHRLPGQWTDALEEDEPDQPQEAVLVLSLEQNGAMTLARYDGEGSRLYACQGTWEFDFVPDLNDRLTLSFAGTDNPAFAGEAYSAECVYEVYVESWEEDDTRVSYLTLTPFSDEAGASPFTDLYDWEITLHRRQGPNMTVVNCQSYVTLRAERSQNAERVKRVPLNAKVLAFPEYGDENGFIYCLYDGEYGYILADYLQTIR